MLSLQGNEAVLWRHLQLQIHRLSCPPWKPEVTPIRLMCKVMPQREAATAPSSKLEESLQSLPWFEPTLKIHSPSLILVPNMKTIFVWRNKQTLHLKSWDSWMYTYTMKSKWKWWGACLLYTVDYVTLLQWYNVLPYKLMAQFLNYSKLLFLTILACLGNKLHSNM